MQNANNQRAQRSVNKHLVISFQCLLLSEQNKEMIYSDNNNNISRGDL